MQSERRGNTKMFLLRHLSALKSAEAGKDELEVRYIQQVPEAAIALQAGPVGRSTNA